MLDSPYEPGPGARPSVVVGRTRQLDRAGAVLARTAATGRPAASAVCFTGSRGTGKTVTLDLVRDRARELGFVTSEVTRFDKTSSSPQRLAAGIAEGAQAAGLDQSSRWDRWRQRLAQMSVEVSAGIVKVTGRLPEVGEDPGQRDSLTNLLVETAVLARESNRAGLAVFVDELQEAGYPDPERSDLVVIANAVQDSLRRDAPIAFMTAGLPDTPDRVMAAASFAERFDFNQLPMLAPDEAEIALLQPAAELGVRFDPDAADKVLRAAGGSPFLVQLYGDELWQRAAPERGATLTGAEAEAAIQDANTNLSTGMFRGRWGKATDAEKTVMTAIAAAAGPDGVAATSDVTDQLGANDPRAWSRVRDQLIDKGLVEAPARGRVGFTMPGFAQYVRDHHGPDLERVNRTARPRVDMHAVQEQVAGLLNAGDEQGSRRNDDPPSPSYPRGPHQ